MQENIIILADNNYQIAYDDKNEKFYFREMKQPGLLGVGSWVEMTHTPPFNIEVAGKEVVVFSMVGKVELGYREKKKGGGWLFGICENNSLTPTNENALPRDIFSWHEQRQQVFTQIKDINAKPLSSEQEQILGSLLIGSPQGVLGDIKKTCTSVDEYTNCLLYLMDIEKQPPQLKLAETSKDLAAAKKYLTPEFLRETSLNSRYEGHMLTLAEARKYMQKILQAELKEVNPNLQIPPLKLDQATWDYLCWPGEDPGELRLRNNAKPIYEKPLAQQIHIKKAIQAIEAVYKFKSVPIALKNGLDLPTLQTAAKHLIELLNVDYQSDLANLARPFLMPMLGRKENFDVLKKDFLLPLYHAVAGEIHRTNLNLHLPRADQFQRLRVDEWDNIQRWATHADFVREQFKNPYAVFVIPDNFDDANLPPEKRHERQARGGLAGPMAPVKVAPNRPSGSPSYDVCTLGVPTGGRFDRDAEAAKQEIEKHFANLYVQVRQGRTIVVPYTSRQGEMIPAFGTGTFADSALTAQLRPFIFEEFKKLKNFCNGAPLDPKYQTAWDNAANTAILPLPEIAVPSLAPAEQPAIVGKDLLNRWFSLRLQEWFDERNLGKLTESIDEKSNAPTLTGRLSTGAQITIYNDKIVLNNSDKMTPDEFRDSMRELIKMYIDSYAPGEPPPTRALGTDEQKGIISQLLIEAKIKVASDKPKPAAPATGEAEPPPLRQADDSSERPPSPSRH